MTSSFLGASCSTIPAMRMAFREQITTAVEIGQFRAVKFYDNIIYSQCVKCREAMFDGLDLSFSDLQSGAMVA